MSRGGAWPVGTCGVCGHAGQARQTRLPRASRSVPALLSRRISRAGAAVVCGRERPIHVRARDGQPDICARLRASPARGALRRLRAHRADRDRGRDDAPAVGRCCYRPPQRRLQRVRARSAVRFAAAGPAPLCSTLQGARRHAAICVDCGAAAPAPPPCRRRRDLRSLRQAPRQHAWRMPRLLHASAACRRPLQACRLFSASHRDLRERADPAAAAALAPFLAALAAAPQSRVDAALAADAHARAARAAARRADRRSAIAALTLPQRRCARPSGRRFSETHWSHHGVLERRDEHSAAFARWQQRATNVVAQGPDRAHVRAYGSWHVAHQLAASNGMTVRRERNRSTPALS